jgi:hypothetical protein
MHFARVNCGREPWPSGGMLDPFNNLIGSYCERDESQFLSLDPQSEAKRNTIGRAAFMWKIWIFEETRN